MPKRSLSLFALVLLGGTTPAGTAEEPRVLIERAVKAVGGLDAVKQRVAVRMKVKGTMHHEGLGQAMALDGEVWEFASRSKLAFHTELLGNKVQATVVMAGEKSWMDVNGQIHDLSKEDLASQRASQHQDRVTNLTSLLTDKGFTFAPLDDIKVEGRKVCGIKVSYKDQPDTSLYFDKESGLLVKYAYRAKKSGDTKEALHETILSDYREPDLAAADEKVLRQAKLDVAGPALVTFLRARTPSRVAVERARASIGKLGDDAFKVREQASKDLVAIGAIALPLLRQAAKNDDREVARRARECLQRIGEESSKTQTVAVIHLLGLRKPAGAAEALLNYLHDGDADLTNDVRAALFAVAHDGKPDSVLVQALSDKDPVRRQAAEAALGKDGGAYAKQPGRQLFPRTHKMAMKHKSSVDGKLELELETSEYRFFNAFDDKVFAKP